MVSVIANWIYILVTTYILGFVILRNMAEVAYLYSKKGTKKAVYRFKLKGSNFLAGIVAATVYAEVFSIIYKVGLIANLFLILICVAFAYQFREDLAEHLKTVFGAMDRLEFFLYLFVFLLMAYGTSHGLMHYDSDLYHAQAIRWIEEYGVIYGLGNLHLRLGYNSASFAVSALYSFGFLGQSMHAVAGYCALLLGWQCVELKNIVRRRYPVLSDFVRIISVYYLFTIFDEMVSPATDLFMTTIVLNIIIRWLDLYAEHERAFLPHALLAITSVFLTTVKLSAAPLMLLSIYPIYRIITRRKKEAIKPLILCIVLAFIIAFPYFVRNYVLTGWLIYPFTGIDIFNVAWKVPKGTALYDAHEIIAYGKGFTDSLMYNAKIGEWLPAWFANLTTFNKLMLILDVVALPVLVGCCIYYVVVTFVKRGEKRADSENPQSTIFHLSHRKAVSLSDFIFIEIITYLCLFYWLFTSPLGRYGFVYIWLPSIIMIGRFAIILYNRAGLAKTEWVYRAIIGALAVYIVCKCGVLIKEDVPRFRADYLVKQQDYGTYETIQKDINSVTFYQPVEGDRTGYDAFPSSPDLDGVTLKGYRIRNGFLPRKGQDGNDAENEVK